MSDLIPALFRVLAIWNAGKENPPEVPPRKRKNHSPDPRPELPDPLAPMNPDLPIFCPKCGGKARALNTCPECRKKK